MSKSPNDHQKVISFIKEYRPSPPPGTATLESQLLTKISQESSPYYYKNSWRVWLIFSALVASLGGIWAGHRWSQPSYELTENPNDLEAFMVETWQGTMGESSLYSDWSIVETSNTKYLVSTP